MEEANGSTTRVGREDETREGEGVLRRQGFGRSVVDGSRSEAQDQRKEPPVPASNPTNWIRAGLLALAGSVLLGVAVWRSGTLPRCGAVWIVSAVMFYVLGVVLGLATTGAGLVTQPIASLLLVASGGWIALHAMRHPRAATVWPIVRSRVN